MSEDLAKGPQDSRNPPPVARFEDILNVHTLEESPTDQWERLIKACQLGHLGAIGELARCVDDPIADQVAADSLLLHGRADLAKPLYQKIAAEALQDAGGLDAILRARLGLAATHLKSNDAVAALAEAALAMAACFELAVLDDTFASGYHLNCEVGEYLGEFPLQWAATALIDHSACTAALRAQLQYFLFLAGGCENKALLHESFAVLQAPEQFFWIAQEHYRAGEFALGIECEIRYAEYVCSRGGIPQICCSALDELSDITDWRCRLTANDASRLLDLAVPMILGTTDEDLVQALAPFFASGGIDFLRRANRFSEIVAIVDRLDSTKPTYMCENRAMIDDLAKDRQAALVALNSN